MYDIVGSLPPELVAQVVQYLGCVEDILRGQSVSKRWRTIFSSNAIIAPFLRETFAFLGLDSDDVCTDAVIADARIYFRWRYGLQHAQPVKKIFLPWPEHLPGRPDKIQYHSRRLYYKN
ncbi:hypothetical protein VTN49DRAFT_5974 [Thermomyces lanuginosus]|uniref:uncharacterized protein n=1 Tax=Thermomyces lanuginosus TaxID=5541 RepID=UPI00374331A6